jgi:LPXTG-site transpeptidase (sortase) family protein
VVLQALVLLVLFSVQALVLVGVRADLRADRGLGESVAVGAVEQGVSPPVALTIPALGIDSRLIGLRKNTDGSLQVPEDPMRAGWYSQGPAPGDDGPAVIVGHVDSYRGPGIFARLDRLALGDVMDVRRADGSVAAFVVISVETFAKRDFPTERVYAGDGTSSLRLVTCGGEFDAKAKSYLDNVIVFAVPV